MLKKNLCTLDCNTKLIKFVSFCFIQLYFKSICIKAIINERVCFDKWFKKEKARSYFKESQLALLIYSKHGNEISFTWNRNNACKVWKKTQAQQLNLNLTWTNKQSPEYKYALINKKNPMSADFQIATNITGILEIVQ